MAELGRRGGKARGRTREEQVGDRRAELAWEALVDLATSGSDTAKVRAASELLSRLDPLLAGGGRGMLEMGRKQAHREFAEQMREVAASARVKLEALVERRARALAQEMAAAAEGRAREAEARLAEFTAGPDPDGAG